MRDGRPVRCYGLVRQGYPAVRDVLVADALGVFQRATNTAAARTDALGTELHVRLGSIEIGAGITIAVNAVTERIDAREIAATRIDLEWRATKRPGLFPSMKASLSIYPLSATETQLDLQGQYTPPLGVIGSAADALMLHRLAEAAVGHFVTEVADRLRHDLEGSGTHAYVH
ncbi:MAG TPA: hypothetical protein VL463_29560 [Kofleriaceae bacterium]|nr:hypothetical protein [Kofleriaceae bacterium]